MPKRYWTHYEVAKMKAMIDGRYTTAEIGLELGRNRWSVQNKINKLGIGLGRIGRPPDVYQRARIVDGLKRGLTLNKIGKLISRSEKTVRRVVGQLVREGVVKRNNGRTNSCRYTVTRDWDRY